MTDKIAQLLSKSHTLPKKPGCYLMKRSDGQIIYVGKAKDLKSRVSSYFNQSAKTAKTQVLVSHIDDFDFMMAESESAALVLENNLIKKHAPKYNVRLKDDKSYPYVVIKHNEPFSRLEYTRRVKRDKDIEIFGPFVTGSNISEILRILVKSFRLRDCTLSEFKKRKEPCLLYQMKQCSAPCVALISDGDYEKDLNLAKQVFLGKPHKTIAYLKEKMDQQAEAEHFEQAAQLRDAIATLEVFVENSGQKNAELFGQTQNLDVLAYTVGESEIDVAFYIVRNGLLIGNKGFHFSKDECQDDIEDELLQFFAQYYSMTRDSIPEVVAISLDEEKQKVLQEALQEMHSEKKIKVVSSAKKFDSLGTLAYEFACEQQRVRLANNASFYVALNQLQSLLNLKERPILLECFDVAIWQGSSPTASQIVFHDGKPDKKAYRYYHLEEREEGNNDFAMMKEVITRRVAHGRLPDLFIVDGGKGQVSSFCQALKECQVDVPVIGLAKAKTLSDFKSKKIQTSEERLIIPGRANPFVLKNNTALYKLMTQMRDEAHRFSRKLHHKAEKKRLFS